jgi:outer membrane protein W
MIKGKWIKNMNQEINMKKLTALLLGTAVSIAFTANALAADPMSVAKNWLMSDDGNTGVYIGLTYDQGDIDDVNADYLQNQSANNATSTWQLDDGKGFHTAAGMDFGKIRFDWRVGAMHSQVETIDNAALEPGTTNTAAFAYSTANVALDLYRFVLIGEDKAWNEAIPVVAITPYVEGGWGYGGGWMTGKKTTSGAGTDDKRDAAGHGHVYTIGGGALINLTSFAGITVGYNQLNMTFDAEDVTIHNTEVGLRLTF